MEENFPQQPSDPGSRMSLTEIARAIANKTGMAYNEVLTEVLRQGQIPSAWNLGTTGISMLISNIVNKLKGKGMAGGGPIYEAADQAAAIRNAIEDVWNSGHGVTKQAVWEALRGQNIPPSRFANIAHAQMKYMGLIEHRKMAGGGPVYLAAGGVGKGQTITSTLLNNMYLMRQLFGAEQPYASSPSINIGGGGGRQDERAKGFLQAWDPAHARPSDEFMKALPEMAASQVGGLARFLSAANFPGGGLLYETELEQRRRDILGGELARLRRPGVIPEVGDILPAEIGFTPPSPDEGWARASARMRSTEPSTPGDPFGKFPVRVPEPSQPSEFAKTLGLSPLAKGQRLPLGSFDVPMPKGLAGYERMPLDVLGGIIPFLEEAKTPEAMREEIAKAWAPSGSAEDIHEALRVKTGKFAGAQTMRGVSDYWRQYQKAQAARSFDPKWALQELFEGEQPTAKFFDTPAMKEAKASLRLLSRETGIGKGLAEGGWAYLAKGSGKFDWGPAGDVPWSTVWSRKGAYPAEKPKPPVAAKSQWEGREDIERALKADLPGPVELSKEDKLKSLQEEYRHLGSVSLAATQGGLPLMAKELKKKMADLDARARAIAFEGGRAFNVQEELTKDWADIENMIENIQAAQKPENIELWSEEMERVAKALAKLPPEEQLERQTGGEITTPESMQRKLQAHGGNVPVGSRSHDTAKTVLKEGEYVVRNEAMANPVNAAIVQTINESKGQVDLRGLLGRKMAAGGEVGATSPALDAPQYPRVGEEKQREHDVEMRDLLKEIRDLLKALDKAESGSNGGKMPQVGGGSLPPFSGKPRMWSKSVGDILRIIGGG